MTIRSHLALSAALCVAMLGVAVPSVSAAPIAGQAASLLPPNQLSSLLAQVQYRGQYQGRRYNGYAGNRSRRGNGRNLALGIGGLIIGGIVLSEAARHQHRQEHGSDWQRCADTYRSFEPDTGMYTGYDGARHTCPYLR